MDQPPPLLSALLCGIANRISMCRPRVFSLHIISVGIPLPLGKTLPGPDFLGGVKWKQFCIRYRHQLIWPVVTHKEAVWGWVLAGCSPVSTFQSHWPLDEGASWLCLVIYINNTSRCISGHLSPSLKSCSQSPEFFLEPHEEKDEMRCLTPASMILSLQPFENWVLHTLSYNTQVLLRKEH